MKQAEQDLLDRTISEPMITNLPDGYPA